MQKPLTVWSTKNCEKFLKKWEYQTIIPVSWETCMWLKKQQFEHSMEQWTGSIFGKEYIKAIYCHSAYLTYMQYTSCKIPGWMSYKLESIAGRDNNLRYGDDSTLMAESKEELKSLLMRWKRRVKSWLKTHHSKNKDLGIWSHHSMANGWGESRSSDRFSLLGLQNHCRWWLQPWN